MSEDKKSKDLNKITKKEISMGENGPYVSEVQYFDTPEDYNDAFKKYYPENKAPKL